MVSKMGSTGLRHSNAAHVEHDGTGNRDIYLRKDVVLQQRHREQGNWLSTSLIPIARTSNHIGVGPGV